MDALKNISCKLCGKLSSDVPFYVRTRTGTKKQYFSPYCKECERKKARERKKERYHDPILGQKMKERAKERTGTEEYKNERNRVFKNKYANDSEFRNRIIGRQSNNRMNDQYLEEKRKRAAEYYQKHKSEIIQKSKEKKLQNPRLKIRGYMRSRVSEALKKFGESKGGTSSLAYLPYSWEDLYKHLGDQFEPWMSFSNYGKTDGKSWQVDHIIPQAFFPYETMDCNLFRMCWDLRNLRPYDSELNISDGNRKHLLGPVRSIYDVFSEIRSGSIERKETIQGILEYAKTVQEVTDSCNMSMVGLNYLDSIFSVRFDANTSRFPSLSQALLDDDILFKTIIFLIKKNERVTLRTVHGALRYAVRTPGHFFPMAAVSFLKKHTNSSSRVFDPFLGWGGRCLASACSDVLSYEGCDLQKEVTKGCTQVSRDFEKDWKFHNEDSLEFLRCTDTKYDLVFTSPPFLDTENYGIDTDSVRGSWLDDFVFPIAEQFRYHLNPSGLVALHLKDIKGAPTFTAYHSAMKAAGFSQVTKYRYGRTWTQSIYVYSL